MKRCLQVLALLLALARSDGAAQPAAPIPVALDELIQKNLQALGGAEKVRGVRSWKMTGKIVTPPINEGGGPAPKGEMVPVPLSVTVKLPNFSRMEIQTPQETMLSIYDGKRAWSRAPGSDSLQEMEGTEGIEALIVCFLKLFPDAVLPLSEYRAHEHKIEMAGNEKLEGGEAYKLNIRKQNGEKSQVLIDSRTFTKVKQSEIYGTIDVDVHYGDYRPVQGVQFPHSIEFKAYGGQTFGKITLEKIDINPAIDDALFKTPARQE